MTLGRVASRRVVLVGHAGDEHCDYLEERLRDRADRVDVARLSLEDLPQADFSWTPMDRLAFGNLRSGPPTSGLWRRPGTPDLSQFQAAYHGFVEAECRDAFIGGFAGEPVAWVTDPDVLRRAERKLYQLKTAAQIGIPIPETVVTNSAPTAVAFARRYGEVVVKPVRYGLLGTEPDSLVAWTAEATAAELESLSGPPVILQRRIAAKAHLRIVTVGEESFISSLAAKELDWRSRLENHELFEAVVLDAYPQVVSAGQALARRLELGFSSQDWIVPIEGQPVFLEANPNGQWLFLEGPHGGAIGRAVVNLLLSLSKSNGAILP